MNFLRQSTASQSRILGAFLDDTDGTTPETALTIANTDVKLMSEGGASANKNSGGGTHRINGHYSFTFDATDTATVGELTVSIDVTGALPVWKTFFVLEEAVYDALFASSADGVNATAIRSALGLASANVDTQLSTIDSNVDAVLADTDELQTDLADGGRVDLILDGIAEDTGTTIPGSLATIDGNVDAILVDTGTTIPSLFPTNFASLGINVSGHLSRVTLVDTTTTNTDMLTTAEVNAEVDSALADYDAPTKTEMDTAFTEIKGATFSGTTDSLEAIRDRGDAAWTTGAGGSSPTVEEIRAEIDSNSTQLAAILADTSELQTDWANGGRLDLILDARASQSSVDTIDGIVDDILVDTGTTVPGLINGLNDPTVAEILAGGDVDGFSLEETLKLCLAALAGKLSGAATTTVTIRAADDSKARITATVTADGDRTAITLDGAG